jgi:hypothetical protein
MKEVKMLKKVLVTIAGLLLLTAPAMATEIPEGLAPAPAYNCDYAPSCEVAPGIYGAMASPVKSKFNLSIGGFVELDYAYNSQNLGVNGFALPGAPGGSLPAERSANYLKDQSTFSARTSRFWLKVAGPTFLGAKTNALIETDFAGTSTSDTNVSINEAGFPRLRHAYGSLDWANTQVLFGQFWDIFGPAAAASVDFRHAATMGTPNNPRVAQIRLTQKVNFNSDNSLKLVVGVQNPVQDATTVTNPVAIKVVDVNGKTQTIYTTYTAAGGNMPNIAGQLMFVSKALGVGPGAYGLSMNSLQAGFFGLWGSQKVDPTSHNNDVYGYGFYAFVPLLHSTDGKNRAMTASLETQAYISAGMNWNGANSNFPVVGATNGVNTGTQGTGGTAASLVNNYTSAAKGYGVYGQLIFFPTQDLGITTGYARRNAMNYASYGASNNFEQYNEIIYANASYDLNAAVRFAAEYLHCRTQYNDKIQPIPWTANFGQLNGVRFAGYYFF